MSDDIDTSPAPTRPVPLAIVRWKGGKRHASRDSIMTACGALIPSYATRRTPTLEWYLHTNCYNCAYRLWPTQGPADYLCPASSKDFPPKRRCPHGSGQAACVRCTPSAAQNWPCPNGCTDPTDHDPLHRYTKCTVFPPTKPAGSDGRCREGCESTERAVHRANRRMRFDLADSASMMCYHCDEPVCVACQTTPVDAFASLCDRCADQASGY